MLIIDDTSREIKLVAFEKKTAFVLITKIKSFCSNIESKSLN